MELFAIRPVAFAETSVMFFQFVGVVGLVLSRLIPSTAWARRGKGIFIVGLVGLACAGVLCGSQPTGFSLMAGGTMTTLLVGMNLGTHRTDPGVTTGPEQPRLA